jgi:hypothetical protein
MAGTYNDRLDRQWNNYRLPISTLFNDILLFHFKMTLVLNNLFANSMVAVMTLFAITDYHCSIC